MADWDKGVTQYWYGTQDLGFIFLKLSDGWPLEPSKTLSLKYGKFVVQSPSSLELYFGDIIQCTTYDNKRVANKQAHSVVAPWPRTS